jgi:hypothetical protein
MQLPIDVNQRVVQQENGASDLYEWLVRANCGQTVMPLCLMYVLLAGDM